MTEKMFVWTISKISRQHPGSFARRLLSHHTVRVDADIPGDVVGSFVETLSPQKSIASNVEVGAG
jgi:hypothetical protein